MKRTHIIPTLLLAIAIAFCVSCGPAFKRDFEKDDAAKDWTKEQKKGAVHYAYRIYFSKERENHKGYATIYSRLNFDDLLKDLNGSLNDFDYVLNPEHKDEYTYLDVTHSRKAVEHQEKVVKLITRRMTTAKIDVEFRTIMGQLSTYDAEHANGYSAKQVFAHGDLAVVFPFTSDQIEEAKKDGKLDVIEHLDLNLGKKYDHKVKDPANPDDPNEFLWKSADVVLNLTNYRIKDVPKPETNLGNYIEGYRIVDGKKESKPALKIFITQSKTAVVLVDSDKEGMEGFGQPDVIGQVAGLLSVDAVGAGILSNDALLANLFKESQEEKRIMPKDKPIFVEIAYANQVVNEWEKCDSKNGCDPTVGFLVPFRYTNGRKENYGIRIKFKRMHDHNPEELNPNFREIEWIAKQWTGSSDSEPSVGKVWEYYRPKGKFAGKVQAEIQGPSNPKKIHFVFEDGEEQDVIVTSQSDLVLEKEPFAIAYNEGEKVRWWIEKDKEKIFNKRKRVAQPKSEEGPGQYGTMSEEGSATPPNGYVVPTKKPGDQRPRYE